jgi:pyrimidine operon attenuation protein/uracil phosphoribosyltransferase
VLGIPRGGSQLARALKQHVDLSVDGEGRHYPIIIADDVLTTGRSFKDARSSLDPSEKPIGVVVFARGECPDWVWPIFRVNEWAQSRATGLG